MTKTNRNGQSQRVTERNADKKGKCCGSEEFLTLQKLLSSQTKQNIPHTGDTESLDMYRQQHRYHTNPQTNRNKQKQPETQLSQQTEKDEEKKEKKKQIENNMNRQKQTENDKNRQKQTEMDNVRELRKETQIKGKGKRQETIFFL